MWNDLHIAHLVRNMGVLSFASHVVEQQIRAQPYLFVTHGRLFAELTAEAFGRGNFDLLGYSIRNLSTEV